MIDYLGTCLDGKRRGRIYFAYWRFGPRDFCMFSIFVWTTRDHSREPRILPIPPVSVFSDIRF